MIDKQAADEELYGEWCKGCANYYPSGVNMACANCDKGSEWYDIEKVCEECGCPLDECLCEPAGDI